MTTLATFDLVSERLAEVGITDSWYGSEELNGSGKEHKRMHSLDEHYPTDCITAQQNLPHSSSCRSQLKLYTFGQVSCCEQLPLLAASKWACTQGSGWEAACDLHMGGCLSLLS